MSVSVLNESEKSLSREDKSSFTKMKNDLKSLLSKAHNLRKNILPKGERYASLSQLLSWNNERLKWLQIEEYHPVARLAAFVPERYARYPEKVEDYFNGANATQSRQSSFLALLRNVSKEANEAIREVIVQIEIQNMRFEKAIQSRTKNGVGGKYREMEEIIMREAHTREMVMPRWIDSEGMRKLATITWEHLSNSQTPNPAKLVWFPEDPDCKKALDAYRTAFLALVQGTGSEIQLKTIENYIDVLLEKKKKRFASDFDHYLK